MLRSDASAPLDPARAAAPRRAGRAPAAPPRAFGASGTFDGVLGRSPAFWDIRRRSAAFGSLRVPPGAFGGAARRHRGSAAATGRRGRRRRAAGASLCKPQLPVCNLNAGLEIDTPGPSRAAVTRNYGYSGDFPQSQVRPGHSGGPWPGAPGQNIIREWSIKRRAYDSLVF